jgi:hypothetical protein
VGLRTYVWYVRSKVCASVCASEKGKPVVRRGRKAYGPPRARWEEVAGLSNSRGGASELRPYKEERERMQLPTERSDARLVLHSSSLLYGRACGRCGR